MQRIKTTKNKTKLVLPVTWWKLAVGLAMLLLAVGFGSIYFSNRDNILAGMLTAIGIGGCVYFFYSGSQLGEGGSKYQTRKASPKDNAIILMATRTAEGKDRPSSLLFANVTKVPKGARLHYHRTLNAHYYELLLNPATRKLEPVISVSYTHLTLPTILLV